MMPRQDSRSWMATFYATVGHSGLTHDDIEPEYDLLSDSENHDDISGDYSAFWPFAMRHPTGWPRLMRHVGILATT